MIYPRNLAGASMIFSIIVIAVLTGLDQLSKYLAVRYLMPVGRIELLPGVFHLTYVENDGAAFSILAGQRVFFLIFTAVVVAVLFFLFKKHRGKRKILDASLILLLSGGIGNFIDRMRHGYVVDFFEAAFVKNFAIFNVADVYVTVGAVLLCLFILFGEKAKPKAEEARSHE
jgi:signal peptidase II